MVRMDLWIAVSLISLAIDIGKKDAKTLEESMEEGKQNGNVIILALLLLFLLHFFRHQPEALVPDLAEAEILEEQEDFDLDDLNNNECVPTGLFRSQIEWTLKKSVKPLELGRKNENCQKMSDTEQKAFWISTISIPMEDFRIGVPVHYVSHLSLLR